MGTAQLGTKISDPEADLIVAFLHALTGEQPTIEYPILPVETAQTPRPDVWSLPVPGHSA
jgi:cytochrome c peroxidase